MALSAVELVLSKTVQLQNHETAMSMSALFIYVGFFFLTHKNPCKLENCFPSESLKNILSLLGLDWVAERVAALLEPECANRFCSLSCLLVLTTISDKCWSFTNVGVAVIEVVLQVPWNSPAHLQSLLI